MNVLVRAALRRIDRGGQDSGASGRRRHADDPVCCKRERRKVRMRNRRRQVGFGAEHMAGARLSVPAQDISGEPLNVGPMPRDRAHCGSTQTGGLPGERA